MPSSLAQVLENLTTSLIPPGAKFDKPVIASDLHIYSQNEYFKGFLPGQHSPFTREKFLQTPFPFSFTKLNALCSGAKTTKAILDIAICPVTKRIMQEPRIAHLVYTDWAEEEHRFVLVCDQEALDKRPESFQLVKKIDWDELKEVTNHSVFKEKLKGRASVDPEETEETEFDLMWEDAFTQSKTNFPSIGRDPAPDPFRSSSLHRRHVTGAFF